MSIENDTNTIAAQALLELRAVRDLIETHTKAVITCDPKDMPAILFGCGDALLARGRTIGKLGTRAAESIAPPQGPIATVSHLPSTIPPGEEPEEAPYRSFSPEVPSGVQKVPPLAPPKPPKAPR